MLEKLGYVKREDIVDYLIKNPPSEFELHMLIISTLDPEPSYDKKEEEELFERLSAVDGLNDYLRSTLVRDRNRYFNASSPLEQMQIKGAFSRTAYLKGKLGKPKKTSVKLETKRHSM